MQLLSLKKPNPYVLACGKRAVPFIATIVAIAFLAFSCNSANDDKAEDSGVGGNKNEGLYTVTFDPTSGAWEGSTNDVKVKTDPNNRATLPPEPTKSGYNFAGWHLQDDIDSHEFTSSSVVKENMTVFAVWSGQVMSITFYTKNDNGEEVEFSKRHIAQPVNKVTLNEIPQRDNFTFAGWYTEKEDDILITNKDSDSGDVEFLREIPAENKFILDTTEVTDQSTKVYALWQEHPDHSVVVTFAPYMGVFLKNMFVLAYHGWKLSPTAELPQAGARQYYKPAQTGKWFIDDEDGDPSNDIEFTKDTELQEGTNVTVHAAWEFDKYTVTFNSNEADTFSDSSAKEITVENGCLPSLPAPPKKENYGFAGWYKNDTFTGNPVNTATTFYKDAELFAKWMSALELTAAYPTAAMAIGGSASFVNTADGVDEVHTYTIAFADQVLSFVNDNPALTAQVLVVAGGGGGGGAYNYNSGTVAGSGGGGGGVINHDTFSITNKTYAITVGAGGGGAAHANNGTNGGDSAIASNGSDIICAKGGGGGAKHIAGSSGLAGGSSGGSVFATSPSVLQGTKGGGTFHGNTGGTSRYDNGVGYIGYTAGGGGGAGSTGKNATSDAGATTNAGKGGDGGSGWTWPVNGITYSAGGSGGKTGSAAGAPNTGNGGAGGGNGASSLNGYAGGSGIVIVRFPYSL